MLPNSGHASDTLRSLLIEALGEEERTHGKVKWWTWLGTEEAIDHLPKADHDAWATMDARERGRWLTARLWNCTDIMAGVDLAILDMDPGHTYAQAVRYMRRALDDSPRQGGRPTKYGEPMTPLHVSIPHSLAVQLNTACSARGMGKADGVRQAVAAWVEEPGGMAAEVEIGAS